MIILKHKTAKPSHYDGAADNYDEFNEMRSKQMNKLLENILKKNRSHTVLDLTCGTGSQVFWLTKRRFDVTGVDINSKMLTVARQKEKKAHSGAKFFKGDMRTSKMGEFDAVLTIFNSVGHLTKRDFEKAMRNIHANLKPDGIYIFDIFNLSYFATGNNITRLTIDWQEIKGGQKVRDIQYSTIDSNGILASYTTSYVQKGLKPPTRIGSSGQSLQIYSPTQLKEMLHRNGFKVLTQFGIDGKKLIEKKSERIITIARKL